MSKKVILRGTTEALDSGIGGKSSVEVQGGLVGGAGGTATVAGMLTNLGVIHLHGGTGANAGGGVLLDSGQLHNFGSLLIGAGHEAGGVGATLIDSGALSNAGMIAVGGDALGGGGVLSIVSGGVLSNAGSITLQGGGGYGGHGVAGAQLDDAGRLVNSGVVTVEAGFYALASYGATLADRGVLSNDGTILIAGSEGSPLARNTASAGFLSVTGVLDNTGEVIVEAGYAGLHGGFGGLLEVTNHATLLNAGTIDIQGAAGTGANGFLSVTNGGTVIDSGAITVEGRLDIAAGSLTIDAAGTLIVESSPIHGLVTVEGTLTNGGTLSLAGGYVDRHDTVFDGGVLVNSGDLVNTGQLQIGGAEYSSFLHPYPSGATLLDVGTLTNRGIIFVTSGPEGRKSRTGTGSASRSNGRIVQTPNAGVLDVGGVLNNSGIINVLAGYAYYGSAQAGGALMVSGTLSNAGSITIGASSSTEGDGTGYYDTGYSATLTVTGVLVNTGDISLLGDGPIPPYSYMVLGGQGGVLNNAGLVTNSGLITIDSGSSEATLNDTGLLNNTGSIVIQAGSLMYYGSYVGGTGGVLAVTNILNNYGTLTVAGSPGGRGYGGSLLAGGIVNNAGTLVVAGGGTDSTTGYSGFGGVVVDSGPLTNTGTILIGGGSNAAAFTGGTLIDSRVLTNSDSGTIDIGGGSGAGVGLLSITETGTLANVGNIGGEGTLSNHGRINLYGYTSTGGSITAAALVNDGSIAGNFANFTITSPITADAGDAGRIGFAGGTLTLNGAVGARESVVFHPGGGTLAFGAIHAFNGVLDGLSSNTVLDIVGATATTVSATGTVLSIGFANGSSADITLGAPLDGLTPHLAGDGHGGTDIIFGAAAAQAGVVSPLVAPSHGFAAAEPVSAVATHSFAAPERHFADTAYPMLWRMHAQ